MSLALGIVDVEEPVGNAELTLAAIFVGADAGTDDEDTALVEVASPPPARVVDASTDVDVLAAISNTTVLSVLQQAALEPFLSQPDTTVLFA